MSARMLAVVVLLLSGCYRMHAEEDLAGGDGPGLPAAASPAEALDAWCAEYADLWCSRDEECCQTGWEAETRANCREHVRSFCLMPAASAFTGNARPDEARMDRCRDAVEQRFSTCDPEATLDETACDVLVGLAAQGEGCADSVECQPGLYCETPDVSVVGTCAPVPTAGSACSFWTGCAAGSVCAGAVCRLVQPEGARCQQFVDGSDCDEHGACGADGLCVRLRDPGEACVQDGDCFGWGSTCRDGLCRAWADPAGFCWDYVPGDGD